MTTKDKFKDLNPAMQLIKKAQGAQDSAAAPADMAQVPPVEVNAKEPPVSKGQRPTPPEGYKVNPMFIETKTKRLQLLMQPSLYDDIKTAADTAGVSVNEMVHILLKEAMNARQ